MWSLRSGMRRAVVRGLPIILLCVVLDAEAVSSQISGTVRAVDAGPVPVAEVLIWGSGRLFDRLLTDQDGRFRSGVPRDGIRRISVHHVSFMTEVLVDPAAFSSEISVVLDRLPVALPEIEVTVSRDICSGEPSRRARDLWSAAGSRYARDTGMRGGLAAGHSERGVVSAERLGEVRAARFVPRASRWHGARPGQTLEVRVEEAGYAWPIEPGTPSDAHGRDWAYPNFEERHGYHFATAEFGENHRFYLMEETEEGAELAFCPREGEGTGLRGRIELSGDSMFVSARWSIPTEDPDEGAGGEVVFGEVRDAGGQRHLVPSRGAFWRYASRDALYPDIPRSYYQVIRVNTEWIVSPDSEWPDCRPRWCR